MLVPPYRSKDWHELVQTENTHKKGLKAAHAESIKDKLIKVRENVADFATKVTRSPKLAKTPRICRHGWGK
jgi:hypothetical protein